MTSSNISLKVADLNIDCQVTELENSKKFESDFNLKCSKDHFNKLSDSIAVKKYAPKTELKGFRAGKVPLSIVKSYNHKNLMEDSMNAVLSAFVDHIVKDRKLNLMGQTAIKNVDFSEENGFSAELSFKLSPEFTLPDFSKLKLNVSEYEFSDADLEKPLKSLLTSKANFTEVGKAEKASEGDRLEIDFTGYIEGEKFDGGSAEGAQLILGSKSFIDGFESQLVGSKAGDKKKIKVTFPDDYHVPTLASKPAEFEVVVHKVSKNTAVVNDDLAKEFGLDSLEKLKEALKVNLQSRLSSAAFTATKKDLLDLLDKTFECEIPQFALEQEKEFVNKQYPNNIAEDKDEIEKLTKRRVKLAMLFSKAAAEFDIKITEDDFKAEILENASNYPGQEKEVINYFMKNPQAIESLKGIITENKTIRKIIELGDKTVIKLSAEQLEKLK